MVEYKRINLEEREKIYLWKKEGQSNKAISALLGRSASTIGRELKRCVKETIGYTPDRAQHIAFERRPRKASAFRREARKRYVLEKLMEGFTPEQIAGRLKRDKNDLYVSHETIYQYIYSEEGRKRKLYWYLARQRPKRSQRIGRRPRKSHIPESAWICNRPQHITTREEFGHIEGDLVVFSSLRSANVTTLVERKSRFVALIHNFNKCTDSVIGGIKKQQERWPADVFKSLTFDRGTEFASYRNLNVPTYFCDPHSPWQKGSNENFNGRLRRYLPKTYNPNMISQAMLDTIAKKMNNQPRKCLGFLTPAEVFYANLYQGVALET